MTSLQTSMRQLSANGGYFIPIASLQNKVYAYNATAGAQTFSTASWANSGITSTMIATAGAGLLRDMGKTVVSASRTFRKVQLVLSTTSTFGVGGNAPTTPNQDFLTGYIELGFEGPGNFSAVACYGR